MSNPYDILGVSPNATDDEIKKSYRKLVQKYHPDAHPDKDFATKKMQEINEAHDKIKDMRKNGNNSYSNQNSYRRNTNNTRNNGNSSRQNTNSSSSKYQNIRDKIKLNLLDEADDLLSNVPSSSRDAEWYYLKGKVSYARGWLNDAQAQFTKAYNMDSSNQEYREAYEKFKEKSSSGVKANPIKDCCNKDCCNKDSCNKDGCSPSMLFYPFRCIGNFIHDLFCVYECPDPCFNIITGGGVCGNCCKCYLCYGCAEQYNCSCCDCCNCC